MDASTSRLRTGSRTIPDVWLIATLVAIAGAFLALLYLDRSLTFWWDEWDFIRIRGMGTVADWLQPHNEHWSTLPLLLYRATFSIIGLGSYLPYVAELLALHAIAVGGVAALVRRDLGPAAAFVAILPLLILGPGFQNLMWAFQTGFVGSTAAGVWALYALDRPGRPALVAGAVLLLVSLMCSGIGLFWLAAAAIELALDSGRRRRLLALIPAVVAYAAWYAGFGAAGVSQHRSPFTLRATLEAIPYAVRSVERSAVLLLGVGRIAGTLLLVLLLAYSGVRLILRSAVPRAIGALGAMFMMFATIGLVRADFAPAGRPRYVYAAAFFLVLAVSSSLGQLAREGRLPTAARWAVAGLAVVSMAAGVGDLRVGNASYERRAQETRAFIAAAQRYEGAPWVDPDAGWRPAPGVAEVTDLVRRYGDPNVDVLVPDVVPPPSADAQDHALVHLMGRNFRADPGVLPAVPAPIRLAAVRNADARVDGSCLIVRSKSSGGSVAVWVDAGGAVALVPNASGHARALIRRGSDPLTWNGIPVELTAGDATRIAVPDTGDGPWQVVVELPPWEVTLCVAGAGS